MIRVFVGKPGMGKTYSLVREAYKKINEGNDIYSNFFMNFNKMKMRPKHGRLFFWETLDELYNLKNGIILIDEIQVYMNSRNWLMLPQRLQYKLQQHRKHGLDIYGAVQNIKRVDTVFRELINTVFQVKKIGYIFITREYDPEDIDKVKKISYALRVYLFNKKLAECYDTFKEITPFKAMFKI